MSRTAVRVANILEQIANSPNGTTLAEITKKQNIPKSTAFDILSSLQKTDMIYVSDIERTKYAIGYKAFAIGMTYQKSSHLINSAKKEILDLSYQLNKPVFLGKIYNNKVVFVHKEETKDSIIKLAEVGDSIPIYCTAIGKVLLAFSKSYEKLVEELELIKLTEKTIIDKCILMDQLDNIRNVGYSVEIGERDDHLYSIAAPIYNFENKISGALSMSYIYNPSIDIELEIQEIRDCAINISRKMGYNGPDFPLPINLETL